MIVEIAGSGAAERVAGRLAETLREALAARGRASLVVTGGSTPGPVYDALAGEGLAWARVEITLSDERWVPLDHPASNERLVRQRLLVGPAAAARFVSLKTPAETPQAGEAEVESRLQAMARPFDAVLLGMGNDGHFASLFPGMEGLAEGLEPKGARLCLGLGAGVDRPPSEPRMTLTLAALASARRVLVFVAGADKLATLRRAEAGEDAMEMPIRALIRAASPLEAVVG